MINGLRQHEQALRRLPLPYSLAVRLRDAGVSADVISLYVDVEVAALDGVYRIAEAKLLAAHEGQHGCDECDWRPSAASHLRAEAGAGVVSTRDQAWTLPPRQKSERELTRAPK